ncbi:MAG: peptidylprolyl isomerase, partial [candidate division Zixibacteria bacterium]|nr:peptidylprolyl isomerase [candidate division Zixibacteria bacterium]
MKHIVTILLGLLLLLGLTIGCSSDEKTETDVTTDAEKTEAVAAVADPADTLAAKRYPIRDENNTFVTIQTDFGNMTLELYRDIAPAHVDSFVARTGEGFYDGTLFFRIIDGFMIQGGDPNNNGTGNANYYLPGPGYTIPAEFNSTKHERGVVSMARTQDPNSAGSQFFICLDKHAHLDGQYT